MSVSANASPTGAIASPLNGAVVPLNTPVLLSATASDSDGS
ncbi:Ig-like domain-containing protein, partial [Roseateles aquae]